MLKLFISEPQSECIKLLSGLIDRWIDFAAETFPKSAAGLSGGELLFQEKKRERKSDFVKKWKCNYGTAVTNKESMSENTFAMFGVLLHNLLFMSWSFSVADSGRPSVTVPDENLVGKNARVVIYYVAGWTLHSMSHAKTVARDKRKMYFDFVWGNRMSRDQAIEADLPTKLVERRKRMAKMYATNNYFEFICFIESIFLTNLTLDMMMAHCNENLMHEIKVTIMSLSEVHEKFVSLCAIDADLQEDGRSKLLQYIIDRYSNMRGTYFIKHIRATGSGSIDRVVDGQATRTRVANAVALSKAVGATKKEADAEQKIWKEAGESVLDRHDGEIGREDV